jgi:DNA primase
LVKRLSPNIIIALDSDAAGRKAAMRAVAGTALSMGMSVKIAEIEGGKDPADLCRDNPELWKNALKNSKHVVEFELNNVLREVSDGHMIARALRERIFPFLARIDSDMDKAYYVRHIAERTRIAEAAVWEDLRKTVAQLAATKQGTLGQTSNQVGAGGRGPTSNSSRYDLVERRLFGLLSVMDQNKHPKVAEYRAEIARIAGKTLEARMKSLEPILSDIAFEAEAFYGADPSRYDIHMKELLVNFEETIIAEELMETMGLLRQAENDKDHAKVVELVKKCQDLSTRKSEIGKKR